MAGSIPERIAVIEQKVDNQEKDISKLDSSLQTLNNTLTKTNEALVKIQLSNAFLSGQRKGVYAVLCSLSSMLGASAAMLIEHFFNKGAPHG